MLSLVKSTCSAFPSRSRRLTWVIGAPGRLADGVLDAGLREPRQERAQAGGAKREVRETELHGIGRARLRPGAAGLDLDQVHDGSVAAIEPGAAERERRARPALEAQGLGVERRERVDPFGADVDVIERAQRDRGIVVGHEARIMAPRRLGRPVR